MSNPKLTIGMAFWNDYAGVWAMVDALRRYHDLRQVEIVLVCNNPRGTAYRRLEKRVADWSLGNRGCRLIPFGDIAGPALAKDAVFRNATGEAVWVLDAHCTVAPGSVAKAIAYFDAHPDTNDLYCGPLVYDNHGTRSTHLNDQWGGGMRGTWGLAWKAPSGEHVSVLSDDGKVKFVTLVQQRPWQHELNGSEFAGHEVRLNEAGFRALGFNDDDEFEIPAQGCFSFACRREAWLGFNDMFRGFGGEEYYLHDKYRTAGRRVVSLGFLNATHRFADDDIESPEGPRNRADQLRNTIIGRLELGQSLEPARKHFVAIGATTDDRWAETVERMAQAQSVLSGDGKSLLAKAQAATAKPPLLRRIGNFSRAAIAHAMNGAPTCTDEEIAARHAICQGCELYKPDEQAPDVGVCTHRDCGCTIQMGRRFVTKLGWRDQTCPLGKWPELDKQPHQPDDSQHQ